MNGNPSYVFFKEMPNDNSGPIGTLGVPLTKERSIAVDIGMAVETAHEPLHAFRVPDGQPAATAKNTGAAICQCGLKGDCSTVVYRGNIGRKAFELLVCFCDQCAFQADLIEN